MIDEGWRSKTLYTLCANRGVDKKKAYHAWTAELKRQGARYWNSVEGVIIDSCPENAGDIESKGLMARRSELL